VVLYYVYYDQIVHDFIDGRIFFEFKAENNKKYLFSTNLYDGYWHDGFRRILCRVFIETRILLEAVPACFKSAQDGFRQK
jgi:hypothetical protein